jgi:hypothetical protein
MSSNPFDWVKSICESKEILLNEDSASQYNPYITNKALSHHIDCLMFANEMNSRHFLNKDMQYMFLINSIRKRKRNHFWVKKINEDNENLELIKKYYNINNDKAYQALKILTKDQIAYIKNKLESFGF